MAVKIRLARFGRKKCPHYRLVSADVRSPRDGDIIERLGYYNPLLKKDNLHRFSCKEDRVQYWLNQGATPTDRVLYLIKDCENIIISDKIRSRLFSKKEKKKT
ncbi:30S ribosomal protein S16 [Rickettsia endosymbiont of Cardiosporidium cionae]|uniref:30S ribosomal protein S16 n=1 Tax=Rickettsia endosymbiont of Cardiosporidium cionae TaxID=2777155 RepID=UPI001893E0A6|nr:30S ribosomal protein S16 [Rickettsia endosymbiont of Cardiosporidium cionae]KAF8818600.1 30S ribosomal protein S16 [Rickettsia endosymbiont of Cardiosporidium cionae]